MNIQRFLKIELLALAFISFLAVPAHFLWDHLADNFFFISSRSADIGFFSYYFSSLAASIAYLVGYWVIFPFLFFLISYSTLYSKRSYWLDLVNPLLLIATILPIFFLLVPDGLGAGFYFFLQNYFSTAGAVLIFFVSLFFFFWATFRGDFIEFLVSLFFRLKNLFPKKSDEIQVAEENQENPLARARAYLLQLKVKVANLLRGDETQKEEISEEETPVPPAAEDAKEEEVASSDDEDSKEEELEQEENTEDSEDEKPEEVPVKVEAPAPKPVKAKNIDKEYFQIVTAFSKPKKNPQSVAPKNDYYEMISHAIQEKLAEFNVPGKIVNVLKGPIVDTFELELGSGVRVAKIGTFEDDLGLALQGVNVRIVPQMRGKSTMGIEVPRNIKEREIIYLDQILNSQEFQKTTAQLPLVMGRDVFGKPAISDLAKLPHLLVAGTTGSGKSVYLNSILVSLLVKKSPTQMKLILIDPKRVELAMFSKLPHLLMPTITDHKRAAVAFLWAIEEMERRYKILLDAQVKNIESFNEKYAERKNDPRFIQNIKQHYTDDRTDYQLPYIVIVIDEFANLVASNSGKEIENSISTLAAKARAAGIHVILATQRPSVDVVSGIVKTNFPARIAFRVAAPQDSKTILNLGGAEKLLGRGDMLFLKDADMLRMHSAYIADDEIEATTDELSKLEVVYDEGALEMLEREAQESAKSSGNIGAAGEDDEYYSKALELVMSTRTASATMLQRRLGIGYPRAGKLIDMLEANGVIGPADGAKPRKVLGSGSGSNDF